MTFGVGNPAEFTHWEWRLSKRDWWPHGLNCSQPILLSIQLVTAH